MFQRLTRFDTEVGEKEGRSSGEEHSMSFGSSSLWELTHVCTMCIWSCEQRKVLCCLIFLFFFLVFFPPCINFHSFIHSKPKSMLTSAWRSP